MSANKEKLTIPDLRKKKGRKERLAMVAVGEFLSARWAEAAGVDIIGVGDSLGMTLYGHDNTLSVTVDQMIHHCKAVREGAPNTFCILAMPYGSYATKKIAVKNAEKMMKESGADAIKMQGGKEMFEIIYIRTRQLARRQEKWFKKEPVNLFIMMDSLRDKKIFKILDCFVKSAERFEKK